MNHYIPKTSDRIWAKLIDEVILIIFSFPVYYYVFMNLSEDGSVILHWSIVLYYILTHLLYEYICYSLFEQTIGKWVFGLYLVDAKNPDKQISHLAILNRIIAMKFNFFFALAPMALALFRFDRRHLADLIAGTRVSAEFKSKKPAKSHWFFASICILFFIPAGLFSAFEKINDLEIHNKYILIKLFQVESDEE